MREDVFILKRGGSARDDLAGSKYLHLFERIKTTAAWAEAGLSVPLGHPREQQAVEYRFAAVRSLDHGEEEALRTGKRYASHFFVLLDYVAAGVSADEFTAHPAHWLDYCHGVLAYRAGNLEKARRHLASALAGDAHEVRYLEEWFQVRYELGDESAAGEALVAFANDMDAYADRMFLWIKLLNKRKLHTRGAAIAIRTDQLLSELVTGARQRKHYSQQQPSFSVYQREKFRKQLAKLTAGSRNQALADAIGRFGGLPEL